MLDRPLPSNTDAERALLGALLLAPDETDIVARIIPDGAWYDPAHSYVWQALLHLAESGVTTVDMLMLGDELRKRGQLEDCGGAAFLSTLVASVPTSANAEHYARMVREAYLHRQIIQTSLDIAGRATDTEEDAAKLIDELGIRISGLAADRSGRRTRTAAEVLPATVEYIQQLHAGDEGVLGISTGFPDLDEYMRLRNGEMTILAARPSIGKTALALNIATNLALSGVPVAFFSLEMTAELLMNRAVFSLSGLSESEIRKGRLTDGQWARLADAYERLGHAPLLVDDAENTVLDIRGKARRMVAKHGIQVIVVDYLQLVPAPVERNRNRENAVSAISGGIKGVAKELNIPALVLAQLNRQAEDNNSKGKSARPRLSHLRESGALEQDADTVALMHRPRDAGDVVTDIDIAKRRNGQTGSCKLLFRQGTTTFASHSRISDADVAAIQPGSAEWITRRRERDADREF